MENTFTEKIKAFFAPDKISGSPDFKSHLPANIGVIIVIVSCFLPFVQVGYQIDSISVNFTHFAGYFVVPLMLIAIILFCYNMSKAAAIPSVISLIVVLYSALTKQQFLDSLGLKKLIYSDFMFYTPGIALHVGFYFMIFGFALIAFDLYRMHRINKKDA